MNLNILAFRHLLIIKMQAQLEYVPDFLVLKNPNAKLVDQVSYLDECLYKASEE